MSKKEINKRIDEIEKYLNLLTTNKIALSTKYFPKFLGLDLRVSLTLSK